MRQLSHSGQHVINDIAQRHGFSVEATLSMLDSLVVGNGTMAQFDHPEFSGSGQWMRGGMTMVSDMFNNHLKGRVDSLCLALSKVIASQPELLRSGGLQSQYRGDGGADNQARVSAGGRQQQNGHDINFGLSSLFVPPAPGTSDDWWPADLRCPNSTGAQNGVRYAYFAQARRLAIEVNGRVTVYDTLDHNIGGFSQQQSEGGTLSFNGRYGPIDIATLPVVSIDREAPFLPRPDVWIEHPMQFENNDCNSGRAPAGDKQDLFATIEKLADLHVKGILSDDEFKSKKAELLARI